MATKRRNGNLVRCSKCREWKPTTEFAVSKNNEAGYQSKCRECHKEYYRSKHGICVRIYNNQRLTSVHREADQPNYSREELEHWINNQPNFDTLYQEWVESGYNRWKAPSCDRINDNLPYTLDNIELKSWFDNHKKIYTVVADNVWNGSEPVYQIDPQTFEIIEEFRSARAGSRKYGNECTLSKVINRFRENPKRFGYIWVKVKDYEEWKQINKL